MQKVKFYTFGCKVNQYDTQVLRENYLSEGFEETENSLADVYVINTCVVTQKAESECLRLFKRLKREYPSKEVVLTGCLGRLLEKNKNGERFVGDLTKERISFFAGHRRAFLKIQDGCDNFCSYCIVPYVRGKSQSKPKELILEELKGLLENGYKEIVLTGICLGDYGKDLTPSLGLLNLLKEIETIEGNFRIRLSSLDPQYINEDLINFLASTKRICPHLHIPFQSGDDFILRIMNRKYTKEFVYDIIEKIREKVPSFIFTTDIMVGFPQEKEENFKNTLEFLEYLRPLKVHLFRFSPRPGTPAEHFEGKVGLKETRRRFSCLKKLEKKWRDFNLRNFVGKRITLLLEKKVSEKLFLGHSEHYFVGLVEAERALLGDLVEVEVKDLEEGKLLCTL